MGLKELTLEEKKRYGWKGKYLTHFMDKEICETCGGDQFRVVFTDYRKNKEGIALSHDVEFFCAKCDTESSGIAFNEDL